MQCRQPLSARMYFALIRRSFSHDNANKGRIDTQALRRQRIEAILLLDIRRIDTYRRQNYGESRMKPLLLYFNYIEEI